MSWPTTPTGADEDDERQHVRIHSQCGACGYIFHARDRLVALLHTGTSVDCCKALDALKFPFVGYGRARGNLGFCRFPECRSCTTAGEAATIHVDCFNLYMRRATRKDKLHRLWLASLGRYPWPGGPALLLPSRPETDRATQLAVDIYDLKSLATIPSEIINTIWSFTSESNEILRFSAVLEMVNFLSHADFDELVSIPLHQVQAWHRGSSPIICKDTSDLFIELTIDSRGIESIKRLETSAYKPRSRFIVYTTLRPSQNVTINFQYGVGRFTAIAGPAQLQITDIPNLLNLTYFRFPSSVPDNRLATIDLASCSGITFFMTQGSTQAIHAHTKATPFAVTTFARLSPPIQLHVRWVYVPNPPSDKISVFGVRLKAISETQLLPGSCSYLIRTPYKGDFTVGPYHEGSVKDFAVFTSTRSNLVYTIPERNPVSVLGVITQGSGCSGLSTSCPSGPPPLTDAFYSTVLLKSVASIWIFCDRLTEVCRGIIVEYLNGSQQALGCCRLGLDPVERCADMARFVFAPKELPLENGPPWRVVEVKIYPAPDDYSNIGDGWTRCAEGDTLEVWTTEAEMVMNVIHKV